MNVNHQLLYALMLHARMFEERCSILYAQRLIAGFCHLYSGQEAIAIGIQAVMDMDDSSITGYRCHVHAILSRIKAYSSLTQCGSVIEDFDTIQALINDSSQAKTTLAELMGRQTGGSKGKGGSMHLYDAEYNYYGGHGIVGIQVPLGLGLAFADRYRKTPNVTFAYLGDGAMNQGQVMEAFNMADLWKLPIVFVLENNGFAIGTAVQRACAHDFCDRARGFGLSARKVDGMNVLEVIAAATEARKYALENGPVFLEMDTYRYRPHSMSDPATYRTREDVQKVREARDPIEFIKTEIRKKQPDFDFTRYEQAEKARLNDIIEYASNSPIPGEEELYTDIFATAI